MLAPSIHELTLHESSENGKDIYRQYQGDGQLLNYEDRASKERIHYSYDLEGLLRINRIRDHKGKEISYVNYRYDEADNLTDMILVNNGGSHHKDGSRIVHKYTYEYWDSY